MALLSISTEEVKRRKIVAPGWYHSKIKDYRYEKNSEGDAMNHIFDIVGLENDALGVPFMLFIPEKYPGFGIKIVAAVTKKTMKELEETGFQGELKAFVGEIVKMNVEPEKVKGETRNQIKDFAPADSNFATAEAPKF